MGVNTVIQRNVAQAAADALVAQARASRAAEQNARTRPIHPWYRFDELLALEPRQRAEALRVAVAKADREWSVVALCFCAIALSLGVVLTLAWLGKSMGIWTAAVFIVCALPFVLLRRAAAHRHLVAHLRADTTTHSAPSPGGLK